MRLSNLLRRVEGYSTNAGGEGNGSGMPMVGLTPGSEQEIESNPDSINCREDQARYDISNHGEFADESNVVANAA